MDNQGGGDVTRLDSLDVLGELGETAGSVSDAMRHSHDDE